MSEFRLIGETINGPLNVVLGWNAILKSFYIIIGTDPRTTLYNSYCGHEPFHLSLSHFQNVLDYFKIDNINLKPESELNKKLMNIVIKNELKA